MKLQNIPLDHTDAIIENLLAIRQEIIDAQPKRPVLPVAGLSRACQTRINYISSWFAFYATIASIPAILLFVLDWRSFFFVPPAAMIVFGIPIMILYAVVAKTKDDWFWVRVSGMIIYAYLLGTTLICVLENLFKVK